MTPLSILFLFALLPSLQSLRSLPDCCCVPGRTQRSRSTDGFPPVPQRRSSSDSSTTASPLDTHHTWGLLTQTHTRQDKIFETGASWQVKPYLLYLINYLCVVGESHQQESREKNVKSPWVTVWSITVRSCRSLWHCCSSFPDLSDIWSGPAADVDAEIKWLDVSLWDRINQNVLFCICTHHIIPGMTGAQLRGSLL